MMKMILAGMCGLCLLAGGTNAQDADQQGQQEGHRSVRSARMEPTPYEKLFGAVQEGDAATVAQLLDEGVDVNARSRWRVTKGATPIMIALENNPSRAVIEQLIERGAKIDARDEEGRSVLMYAMKRKDDQGLAEMLIDMGAMVSARDADGRSALMYACAYGSDIDLVRLLLDRGARIDARDGEGRTPLMYAVRRESDSGVISMLVDHGASIKERDAYDRDVLFNAAAYARSGDIIDTLVDLGADVNGRLSKESLRKNMLSRTGDTVLSFACVLNRNAGVLNALLRHGADINGDVVVGDFQRVPGEPGFVTRPRSHLYLIARYADSPEVLDAALDAGAIPERIDLLDERIDTPLEAARSNRMIYGTDAYWRLNDISYD